MIDVFDLEAEMQDQAEWDAKVQRARARVAAFNALPRDQQMRQLAASPDAEQMRAARHALRVLAARKEPHD